MERYYHDMSDTNTERGTGPRPHVDGIGRVIAPASTHDAKVESRLLAIAWFTGIVAAAVVANFIATVAIAASSSVQY